MMFSSDVGSRLSVLLTALLFAVTALADEAKKPAAASRERPAIGSDDQVRRQVTGAWEDDYQGKRTMTLREDGSGTMVVELDGVKARLFASRLQFEMKWSVEKGRLKKQTVRGEPAALVQMILKTMGDRVDEQILELSQDRLQLLDQDGKTKYEWRRVKEQ